MGKALLLRFLSALCFLGLVACSDDGKTAAPCTGSACDLDAGTMATADTTPRRDGGPPPRRDLQVDAAFTDELRARVQVNGATSTCGACAVILAQVQGGKLPYTYEWSEPTLSGPGPHTVCPDKPTSYSVIVTDSSASGTGEFATEAQEVEAVGETQCTPGDAGVAFQGCVSSSPDAGAADSGVAMTCGDPNDGGVTFDLLNGARGTVTVSTYLGDGYTGGQTYEYSHDRLIPITLSVGQAVHVNAYGANAHCEKGEKLFELTYDLFTWHQSSCFTPSRDYHYIIIEVELNGAIFSWEFLTSGTTCTGCTAAKP